MSQVRVIAFDGLLASLKEILGDESLLYQRFDFALRQRDSDAIEAAMQSLHIYPEFTRKEVENAMLAWLFGGDDKDDFANSNLPSSQLN